MNFRRHLWCFCACAVLLCAHAGAQTHEKNPYTSPDDVAEGKRMYYLYCVGCHGADGKRPGLTRIASNFRRFGNSDVEMFRTINNGIPGTRMPASSLEEKEVWQILSYVRTLQEGAEAGCEAPGGDPTRGRLVFREKGACLECHTIGFEGGRLGPDLTWIGATRSADELRDALIHPNKDGTEFYRGVKVTDPQGKTHDGVILREDDFSIHLMDRQEQIRSFYKSELQKIEHGEGSIMPAYGELLSEAEINDLLAYLCTLRGPTGKSSE